MNITQAEIERQHPAMLEYVRDNMNDVRKKHVSAKIALSITDNGIGIIDSDKDASNLRALETAG